jgi:hypothetical protein
VSPKPNPNDFEKLVVLLDSLFEELDLLFVRINFGGQLGVQAVQFRFNFNVLHINLRTINTNLEYAAVERRRAACGGGQKLRRQKAALRGRSCGLNCLCNENSNKAAAYEARHEAGNAKTERQLASGDQKVIPKEAPGKWLAKVRMKVEIFSLCDFASSEPGGKLNVIGIFDLVWARETPAVYGLCALATRVRFEKIEEGIKKFRMSFSDADGKPVMPSLEAQIQVMIPPVASHASVQVVSLIQQIKFPNFGQYSIDLAIDGRQEASILLDVRQMPLIPPHLQIPQSPLQ